jgi:hypothetical protein
MSKPTISTIVSAVPVNAKEMKERGFENLKSHLRTEVWWLVTEKDYRDYEQHRHTDPFDGGGTSHSDDDHVDRDLCWC